MSKRKAHRARRRPSVVRENARRRAPLCAFSRRVNRIAAALFLLAAAVTSSAAPRVECVAGCGQGPKLVEPFGVAAGRNGDWYICEYKGQRITRADAQGNFTLFAGGERDPKAFLDPHGLVVARGQMYVADTLNHRVVRIDLKTGRTAVVAGTGKQGFSGDGGPATEAAFNGIYSVDANRSGDRLYLTDLQNRRVRLVDLKSGKVSTVAGNGQSAVPADGADAATSPLVDPRAAAVDSKGNVYILERRGNALRVVDRKGKIRTVIAPGLSAPGNAKPDLKGPKHLFVDRRDNVIIADAENHLVRRFNPRDGTTVIIAGTGEKGERIVADDPLRTELNRPHGVFVHPSGALYISDSYNHRILRLTD